MKLKILPYDSLVGATSEVYKLIHVMSLAYPP